MSQNCRNNEGIQDIIVVQKFSLMSSDLFLWTLFHLVIYKFGGAERYTDAVVVSKLNF